METVHIEHWQPRLRVQVFVETVELGALSDMMAAEAAQSGHLHPSDRVHSSMCAARSAQAERTATEVWGTPAAIVDVNGYRSPAGC